MKRDADLRAASQLRVLASPASDLPAQLLPLGHEMSALVNMGLLFFSEPVKKGIGQVCWDWVARHKGRGGGGRCKLILSTLADEVKRSKAQTL